MKKKYHPFFRHLYLSRLFPFFFFFFFFFFLKHFLISHQKIFFQFQDSNKEKKTTEQCMNQWWIVSVGEEGGVWVWDMKEQRKTKKEEKMGLGYDLSCQFGGILVAVFQLELPWEIKNVCVDFNEFWVGGGR